MTGQPSDLGRRGSDSTGQRIGGGGLGSMVSQPSARPQLLLIAERGPRAGPGLGLTFAVE